MNLRTKAVLILSVGCIVISTGLFYLCRAVVLNGFLSLEQQRTEVNLSTVRNAFQARLSDMDKTAADWGHWDDTYRFIVDRNAAYAKSNLAYEQLKTIHLDTLVILDLQGRIVASRGNGTTARGDQPAKPDLLKAIQGIPKLVHFTDVNGFTKGILTTPSGPLMLAARPVTKSDGTGPIRGTIVMARHLQSGEFASIGKETHSDVEVRPFVDQGLSPDFARAKAAYLSGVRTYFDAPDDHWISGFAVLKDVAGKPMLILRARYPRTILWEGQASVRVLLLALIFSSMALHFISVLLLNRFVLKRVTRLADQVSHIDNVNKGTERVDDFGQDEISSLGASINSMLFDLRASHQSVIESETRLRAINTELEAQGTALEHRNVELAQAQSDLKARNEELVYNEKQLTTALAEAEKSRSLSTVASKRFQDLFDNLPVACFTVDMGDAVIEFNNAAETLWGLPPERVYGQPIDELLNSAEPRPDGPSDRRKVIESGESIENIQARYYRHDGSELWLLTNIFPLRGAEGAIIGVLCACADITEQVRQREVIEAHLEEISNSHSLLELQKQNLAEANQKLEALATTDGLTELNNHRSFQDFLETQFQIAKRTGAPVSVLLMDVDYFKQYNDTFGHLAGDEVLKHLAGTLTHTARGMDFVARYGGEEFVVVLPGTSEEGALQAAERYRAAVEEQNWQFRPITVSVGVATIDSSTTTRADLVTAADQALYESKRAGRNRVTHSNSMQEAA